MDLLTFKLEKNKTKMIDIANNIIKLIDNNALKYNDKLPSKRNLASHLGVSINTIINAYSILEEEGYIYTIPKVGYFISNNNYIKENNKTIINYNNILDNNINTKYDFTTSDIESSLIPTNKLKKIYQEILQDNIYIYKSNFKGDIKLRESICNYLYQFKGIVCQVDQIVISSGIDSLIPQIVKITNSNNICIEDPGYQKINKILKNIDKNIIYQEIDNSGILIPKYNTDLIYTTPYCQFPLGIKMTSKRKSELIEYSKNNNCYIVEDSFDSDFTLKPFITKPLFSLSDNVIYIESFSRSICPSFRLSFMVLPLKLVSLYDKTYNYLSCGVSTIDQMVLTKYLDKYYLSHINKLRTNFRKKRDLIINLLDKKVFDIINDESYLAIIVKPKNNKKNIKDILISKKIKINFINEFSNNYKSDLLMIGYSNISYDGIEEGIRLINEVFK